MTIYTFFFLLAAILTNFVSLKLLDLKSQYFVDKEACEVWLEHVFTFG